MCAAENGFIATKLENDFSPIRRKPLNNVCVSLSPLWIICNRNYAMVKNFSFKKNEESDVSHQHCRSDYTPKTEMVDILNAFSLASCQKRKIAGCACVGNAGNVSPPLRVSYPDMHHGTCVMHVLWCMPGSLTSGFLWSRWPGKRSWHSWHMRNPQIYVSGERPMITKFSTLWPHDAIGQHKSGTTLALAMAWCLMTSSHYLNQCWHIIRGVPWQLPEGNFTISAHSMKNLG